MQQKCTAHVTLVFLGFGQAQCLLFAYNQLAKSVGDTKFKSAKLRTPLALSVL